MVGYKLRVIACFPLAALALFSQSSGYFSSKQSSGSGCSATGANGIVQASNGSGACIAANLGPSVVVGSPAGNDINVLGTNALAGYSSGSDEIAIGDFALNKVDGREVIGIGDSSMSNAHDGRNVIAIGQCAFCMTEASGAATLLDIIAIGDSPMGNGTSTTGSMVNIIAIGTNALNHVISSSASGGTHDDIAIGDGVFGNLTTGVNNIGMGNGSCGGVTTGSNNLCLGQGAVLTGATSNKLKIENGTGSFGANTLIDGDFAARTVAFNNSIATQPIATASLPACVATTGTPWRASVNDATAPAVGSNLTGGGTVFANVHCSLTSGNYIVDGI